MATPSTGASSPQLVLEEGEERKEEEEEEEEEEDSEGIVDLTDSLDEFEVFNQPPSPKSTPEEMGIQRKPQKSLMELIEDQLGRGAPGKSTQSKLPPPSLKSPPPTPQPPQPIRPELVDPKRRMEQKGKKVVETGRSLPTYEDEAQRAAKQQKVSHMSQQAWRERTLSLQSHRPGSQHPYSAVSP